MNQMLLGAIAMACFTASLFFVRFWRTTRDRFFLFFALSFFIEGFGRTTMGLMDNSSEMRPIVYFIRLVAFLVILFAIIDKNWIRKKPQQ